MAETPDPGPQKSKESRPSWYQRARPYLWGGGKWRPAARRTAILISLITNLVLLIVLGLLAQQLFTLKNFINQDIIAGLYTNFVLMDRAHITTTVQVNDTLKVVDTIPVVFDLQLAQDTQVVLTKDTPIENATIILNNQAVPLDLVLKAGTPLSINLDLVVPVSQTVPVALDVPVVLEVPVDIPLADTQLHQPFIGLQEVVSSYYWKLNQTHSWAELPFCQKPLSSVVCKILLLSE